MNDKQFRLVMGAMALYVLVGVICFGPATVQSERAREEYIRECRAEHSIQPNLAMLCPAWAPSMADGAAKAMFWPLWLSYLIASQ